MSILFDSGIAVGMYAILLAAVAVFAVKRVRGRRRPATPADGSRADTV